jgi:hypothetical protein
LGCKIALASICLAPTGQVLKFRMPSTSPLRGKGPNKFETPNLRAPKA